jgi:hypothetical protein
MFVAGAVVTAVLAAPMAAVIWTDAATGGTRVTTSADPGADANAGPGYFNGCINGWCWNAG